MSAGATPAGERPHTPGIVVLALQGGGALGAYQAGAYEAMHESGLEPDWIIGTSIGAINGALIAGNRVEHRLPRLKAFWDGLARPPHPFAGFWPGSPSLWSNLSTLTGGLPGFFAPRSLGWLGVHAAVGVDQASYYTTHELATTLARLIDPDTLNAGSPRLTVGAVNVRTGAMRYFDSRDERLTIDHIRASGALPPAFPAVRIDGEPYWDGGIYSNTPIEAILDDRPRRDALIFSVHVWPATGCDPTSIWHVMGRQKDIQYASHATSHLRRQRELHRLRHVIRELERHLTDDDRSQPGIRELLSYGCGTTMHVVHLDAAGLELDDHTKDIDFTVEGIRARWRAGFADTKRAIDGRQWLERSDPMDGIVEHAS